MPSQQATIPLRLNRKIKKAIMAGEEYKELETLTQFYDQQLSAVKNRIERLEQTMFEFLDSGGDVEYDEQEQKMTITYKEGKTTAEYVIKYDQEGEAVAYYATVCRDKETMRKMHTVLFCQTMLPYYRRHAKTIQSQLKDIKNSVAINSMCDIGKQIRGDTYLTAGAISSFDIADIKGSADPLGIFDEVA